MQKITLLLLACIHIYNAKAQNTFRTIIKDAVTKAPVVSATVLFEKGNIATVTNEEGYAILHKIPDGKQVIKFSRVGYKTREHKFDFPLNDTTAIVIFMEIETADLDEVIVQSTRTSRTIKNTPTRVETIDGEELDE